MKQRKPDNPFILSGYHSPVYFCDRLEEMKWLKEQLANERNIVLHAARRIGKSSLVHHLFHHLSKSKQTDTVFVDLLGTTHLQSANRRIGKAIVHQFGDLTKGLKANMLKLVGSLGATFSLDPTSGMPELTFISRTPTDRSLGAIGEFLSSHPRKIVICLDEFQEILNYPEHEAEALFRNWTQAFPMVRFVFSGSHQHLLQLMFTSEKRPFYKSAQLMELRTISPSNYEPFIRRHFRAGKKSIDPAMITRLMAWAKDQTYYVQLICNKLYGRFEIDELRLEEIFSEVIAQEIPMFSTYQKLLTTFQWKLLSAIAKEEMITNPLSKEFIGKYELGAASSVSTALKKLVATELIINNQGYELQDVLLMRWLQKL